MRRLSNNESSVHSLGDDSPRELHAGNVRNSGMDMPILSGFSTPTGRVLGSSNEEVERERLFKLLELYFQHGGKAGSFLQLLQQEEQAQ